MAEVQMRTGDGYKPVVTVDLPGNSNVEKEAKKEASGREKREKVVKGGVKRRKQTAGKKFFSEVISEDIQDVKSYVLRDVILPALKSTIVETVCSTIEMAIWGEVRGRKRGGSSSSRSSYEYTSYDRYYRQEDRRDRDRGSSVRRRDPRYAIEDFVFDNRADAEDILETMLEILDRERQVCVADLYEMVGITATFTDEDWGWTDLRGATIRPAGRFRSDGYLLILPRAVSLR